MGSIALAPRWSNTPLSGVTPLRNMAVRGNVCSVAAPTTCQSSHAGQPCTSWGSLHQLGSITLAPRWCNTPLSGVTPPRYKQECGRLIVGSGPCGLMGVCVAVLGDDFRQIADPFAKKPRNSAVFAQWVCTLVEWLACCHRCTSWPVLGSQICALAGASVSGMGLSRGVPPPRKRIRDRACR